MDEHAVELNSGLGQAIRYMLNHWKPLTLFYKTLNGARVGDLFMSLIHTCTTWPVSIRSYITALQEHTAEITQNPEKWLPWNYTTALQPDPS